MNMITLTLSHLPSPIGGLMLVTDDSGALYSCEFNDIEVRLHRLLDQRLGAGAYRLSDGPAPGAVSRALTGYFDGDITGIDTLQVVYSGTEFQNAAWAALRRIPAGHTASYGEQAALLGRPKSARAVGGANHLNAIGIVVPCHRVIGASGALTGYAGGLERKRWLLDHESRHSGLRLI